MRNGYAGTVCAPIIDLRFASSGTIARVEKQEGDLVKKGDLIASLDKHPAQLSHEIELMDYEKSRAEFETFRLKNSQTGDDIIKHLLTAKQAELNRSVKAVELSQIQLNKTDLISPVSGAVIEMDTLVPGMHITPGGFTVRIVNLECIRFSFPVPQADLCHFVQPVEIRIKIDSVQTEYQGKTIPPAFGDDDDFSVWAILSDPKGLLPGMKGQAFLPKS